MNTLKHINVLYTTAYFKKVRQVKQTISGGSPTTTPWRYNPLWLYFHSPVAGFSFLVFKVS